jgi:hypothetical protein
MSDILLLIGLVLAVAVFIYVAICMLTHWRVRGLSNGTMKLSLPPFFWILAGFINLFSLMRYLSEGMPNQKLLQLALLMQAIAAVLFFFEAWRQIRFVRGGRLS